ncbi:MAG: O-antigen ligase family protein, partial [Bdellovibrionales bacterium]|nr:O-antigen ligase family protein [Bdellovibrionales bacterium]
IFLIPLIIWYLTTKFSWNQILNSPVSKQFLPLVALLILILASSVFGRAPINSFTEGFKFGFLILIIPTFFELSKYKNPFWFISAIAIGQSISALHTVCESAFPSVFTKFFLGEVTEAGQLAIMTPLLFGIALYLLIVKQNSDWFKSVSIQGIRGAVLFIALGLFAFHKSFNSSNEYIAIFSAIILGFCSWSVITGFRSLLENPLEIGLKLLCSTVFPLIAAALLINLKRGPWLGVFCSLCILVILYERRLLVLMLISFLAAWLIDPIQQRLTDSYAHFMIAGGRGEIWEIGAELLLKYPIGIGYENSPLLRSFSQQIPPQLTHFHSNFINIGVELGWLGLFIYCWWIFETCKFLFKNLNQKLSPGIAISAALFSWHVAGLVEYNFGDSEVVILAFILVGLLPQALKTSNND